jgi:hypothetical protein
MDQEVSADEDSLPAVATATTGQKNGHLQGPRSRPLDDRINNPSGMGVIVSALLIMVPLVVWLWVYILLRYATGHRAPGSRGLFPVDTPIGRRVHYPSLIGVVLAWVIGVFTLVGYLLALYMSYRYLTGKGLNSLAGRLAQLDQAHASGSITDEDYLVRRRAVIGSL